MGYKAGSIKKTMQGRAALEAQVNELKGIIATQNQVLLYAVKKLGGVLRIPADTVMPTGHIKPVVDEKGNVAMMVVDIDSKSGVPVIGARQSGSIILPS
ncbi:MAG: hypothetical protein P4N59_07380 [Negativicutes bacterium]|nr:hypothetical protein [Negativicutes bacterium]